MNAKTSLAKRRANRSCSIGRNGFTLIEVLMAVAIFSIGVLAAASMQTSAVSTTTRLRKATMGVACASDVMERLFFLNFSHPYLSAGTHAPGDGEDEDGDGADDMPVVPEYNSVFESITWTVANQDLDVSTAGVDAKVITVTVSWGGGSRNITLTSARTFKA